eukprot:566442-Pelagomonas_calceolata.AAC.8
MRFDPAPEPLDLREKWMDAQHAGGGDIEDTEDMVDLEEDMAQRCADVSLGQSMGPWDRIWAWRQGFAYEIGCSCKGGKTSHWGRACALVLSRAWAQRMWAQTGTLLTLAEHGHRSRACYWDRIWAGRLGNANELGKGH